MNKKTFTTSLLATSLVLSAYAADDVWSYAECVDYARSNNISLQKLRLSEQVSGLELEEAQAQWQPTLDFNTTHGFTNSPWRSSDSNAYNGQVGFNAGWTVWNG